MMRRRSLMAGLVPPPNIDNVFATTIYTGDETTPRSITTGVNLSANGGMVAIKKTGFGGDHHRSDTVRGASKYLSTNNTNSENTDTDKLISFDANGITLGDHTDINDNSRVFSATSFVKSARFFDVVTWTGDGTGLRAIAHDLKVIPGIIEAKVTSATGEWFVYSKPLADIGDEIFYFDGASSKTHSDQFGTGATLTAPTKSEFFVGSALNANGATYVAYLYAHDPAGVCMTGSYTGNGSATGPIVTLGWEPQYLVLQARQRDTGFAVHNVAYDAANPRTEYITIASSDQIKTGFDVDFDPTGFQIKTSETNINRNAEDFTYFAIKAS